MHEWTLVKRNSARWTARAITALVFLMVLFEVAHSVGFLQALQLPEGKVTELLLLSSVALGSMLIEEFGRTEKSVVQLERQQRASLNISRFEKRFAFHAHWKRMRETFDTFIVCGVVGDEFGDEFTKLWQKEGIRCSLYLSLDVSSEPAARHFLRVCAEGASGRAKKPGSNSFKLYDSPFAKGDIWIVARRSTGPEVEVITCQSQTNDDLFSGLHLNGDSACAFAQCVIPRIEQKNSPDDTDSPVRIYTQRQVGDAVRVRQRNAQDIHSELEKGSILSGVDEVCQAMKSELRETKRFLDVTHICSAQTIPLLREEVFVDWLGANYEARARKVAITRIFIIPKALRKDAMLQAVVAEMREHGVTVLICDLEKLEERYREDFSLYDDRHVVYISHEGGGSWLDVSTTRARRSDDLEKVRSFRQTFDYIRSRAD